MAVNYAHHAVFLVQQEEIAMRLTYDPRYNIAYLHLKERPVEVETIKVSEELNLDLAPDGTIYGFDLLNANEQLAER
jgi:uncharacterized protein YuzE